MTEALLWLLAVLLVVVGVVSCARRQWVIGAVFVVLGVLVAPGVGGLLS